MSSRGSLPELRREELSPGPDLDRRRIFLRVILLVVVAIAVITVISVVPGLESLRSRFGHANWEWLALGVLLKILSGLCYVAAFRAVFCPRMSWRLSSEIGLAELGANALLPVGGAGGLALGAWALRRTGMPTDRIARRSVAFFFLTSIPNVLGVILVGLALAVHVVPGQASLLLSLVPAVIAAGAIVLAIAAGRWAESGRRRSAARRGSEARLPRALAALSGGVEESLALLRTGDPRLLGGLIGYLGFDVLILFCTFAAFGAAPPIAIVSMGYLIGELGGLVPLPGGIGGVELGLVGTLALYHVPVGAATAAVLAYRAIALTVPAVIGAVAFALLKRKLASEELNVTSCTPGGEVDVIGRGRVRLSD